MGAIYCFLIRLKMLTPQARMNPCKPGQNSMAGHVIALRRNLILLFCLMVISNWLLHIYVSTQRLRCSQLWSKASFSSRHWVITETHHYLKVLRISDCECLALRHLHQHPSPRLGKGRFSGHGTAAALLTTQELQLTTEDPPKIKTVTTSAWVLRSYCRWWQLAKSYFPLEVQPLVGFPRSSAWPKNHAHMKSTWEPCGLVSAQCTSACSMGLQMTLGQLKYW